ncbi:MFS transporter [Gandjariella thermophila]|uniref:MFS transporter n=1 Tax=Gandjariella thermophila TaxID=1931992 RepID=A0A4D4J924_9PSEU|nr:MFS transporter [Gandjariella thermophila]GDY31742.1 MFS transporter [Gandjariella thermophila]
MSETDVTQARPREDEPAAAPRNVGLVLAVLAGAQLMVVLDITIITVAVPSIQRGLHFTPTALQWVVNGYTLPFGGLLLLGGRLGDLYGRRRIFQIGAALFVLSSLLGGLAQSQTWLIASRVGQGVGAALLSPTAFSLVATNFPEGPARNRAFGVFGAVSGAASALGVIAGGLLTQLISWRWVFFINVPLGALVLAGAAIYLSESPRLPKKLDIFGALTVTIGSAALVNGAISAADRGWTSAATLTSFGVAVVLLAAFVAIQATHPQPLMSLRLFTNRNRSGAYLMQLLNNAVIIGFYYFLSQFAQEVLHFDPLLTGLALLPAPMCVILSAQLASRLLARVGPLPILVAGTILLGAGLLYASFMSADSTYAGRLLPALLLVPLGFGGMIVTVTVTSIAGVKPQDTGMATGILNTCQQVGGSFGLAAMVTVFVHRIGSSSARPGADVLAHAWGSGLLVAAGIAAASLLVALLTIRKPAGRGAAPRERSTQDSPAPA